MAVKLEYRDEILSRIDELIERTNNSFDLIDTETETSFRTERELGLRKDMFIQIRESIIEDTWEETANLLSELLEGNGDLAVLKEESNQMDLFDYGEITKADLRAEKELEERANMILDLWNIFHGK